MIGTTAALVLGGIAAGGSVASGAMGARAAGKAGKEMSDASERAAQLNLEAAKYEADKQYQIAQEANALQKEMYEQGRADLEPWRKVGSESIMRLGDMMAPGGELTEKWDKEFKPPTLTDDPGYAFRLEQGNQALARSAAARGGSLGGGALKAAVRYNSGMASQEYGAAYDRAAREFEQSYNIWRNDKTDTFNRFSTLSGMGQTTATELGRQGQSYATQAGQNSINAGVNASNIILDGQRTASNYMTDAASARSSGYVGGANAWGQGISQGAGNFTDTLLLSQLMGPNRRKSKPYPNQFAN
jgi:hypothetical protein